MSLKLVPIKGRDNKPVKSKSLNYPQPNSIDLPNNFYTTIVIGGTGSGKTYSVVKLLKYLEEAKHYYPDGTLAPERIILISPTYRTNPLWNSLKNLDENDIYEDYSEKLLGEIIDDIDAKRKDAEKYQKTIAAYKKWERGQQLSPKELIMLYNIDFNMSNIPEPDYKAPPVNHIILDDLVCSNAYKRNGLISNLSVKNRHKMVNLFICSQSCNQIPKIVRLQARLLLIYRYNSKNIIQDLYDLVAGVLTPEQFEEIYFEATKEKYQFLCIDNTRKDIILKQNFDSLIEYEKQNKPVQLKRRPKKDVKEEIA